MKEILREWISRLGGVFERGRSDQDLEQELHLHLEMVEQELRRQGLSPEAAAREGRLRAGHATQTMEALRESRGIPALSTFWLDTKLGLRMLRKHWGLTLIGGFTLAIAMTIGATVFNLVSVMRGSTLPLEEGDRVVVIQPFDAETRQLQNSSREDFERWRAELRSVENVGAFRTVQRNLIDVSGSAAAITVAEMSASGFQVPRIAPLLGRFLLPEDELAAAPPVVVIGHQVWRSKFSADPQVLGQLVRLDGVSHTIVGVMPQGFAFPVNHHYWTNLSPDARDRVVVFARLAPGASVASAHAEVRALGLRDPKSITGTERTLQPRLVPYVSGIADSSDPGGAILAILPFVLPLLLVPPCANLAILIYARTVARQVEFAARLALGASRQRIVAQILIEVFLLAAGAAGIALLLSSKAGILLQSVLVMSDRPFWMNFGLSYQTIVFTAGLALIAAMLAGGIPAFRATARWDLTGMHALRGGSNPQLGKIWTVVVAAQVALSVALVPTVAEFAWDTMRPAIRGPGFHAGEFVTVRLVMDRSVVAGAVRLNAASAEVARHLRSEPGVAAVTISETAPFEEPSVLVQVAAAGGGVRKHPKPASLNHVDDTFFDAFGLPLLTGRQLLASDAGPAQAVVVNRSFTRRILRGGNPLGRRIRVDAATTREYEIVGVVADLFPESHMPTIYQPLPNKGIDRVCLTLHAGRTIPPQLAGRLREIVAAIDPALRVDEIQALDEIHRLSLMGGLAGGGLVASLTLAGVLFSVAGIYTSMAFTVVQRRREIGIRSALGAAPWRLIAGVFRQVLLPVGIGVAFGSLAAMVLDFYLSPLLFDSGADGRPLPWILPGAEMFILLIAAVVLFGPVRRALRIDPMEALRES